MNTNHGMFLLWVCMPVTVSFLFVGLILMLFGYYEVGLIPLEMFTTLGLLYCGYYYYFELVEWNEKD